MVAVTIPRRAPVAISDLVPLRSTTAWTSYVAAQLLPHVYGRVTVAPVPYDREGHLFVLADHPIQGVDRVERDGIATPAWDFRNQTDETGHAVAVLELAEALESGQTLAVDVRGKMDVDTGVMLMQPAQVLWDLVSNVGGLALPLSDFDRFRGETAGMELNGVVGARQTMRSQVDEINLSVGAVWSGGMPGFARLHPAPDDTDEPSRGDFDRLTVTSITSTASAADLVTRLRVLYAYDHAHQVHRKTLEVTAPDAAADYGDLEREIDARWLRQPEHAAALAERLIEYWARPLWRTVFSVQLKNVERKIPRPGTVVSLDHPLAPPSGRLLVLGADIDMGRMAVSVTVASPAGDTPRTTLSHYGTAHEPLAAESVAANYADGVATFTIRDSDARPMSNAVVRLDGGQPKITDASGRVQFTAARGAHQLLVQAPGFSDRLIDVTL